MFFCTVLLFIILFLYRIKFVYPVSVKIYSWLRWKEEAKMADAVSHSSLDSASEEFVLVNGEPRLKVYPVTLFFHNLGRGC